MSDKKTVAQGLVAVELRQVLTFPPGFDETTLEHARERISDILLAANAETARGWLWRFHDVYKRALKILARPPSHAEDQAKAALWFYRAFKGEFPRCRFCGNDATVRAQDIGSTLDAIYVCDDHKGKDTIGKLGLRADPAFHNKKMALQACRKTRLGEETP